MADISEAWTETVEFRIRDLEGPISSNELFGNNHPVEIEIGCGKGRYLITSAETFPDINYVGVERSLHYFRIMKQRVEKRGLRNVRLLRDDAGYLVEKFLPDDSVTAYHIYFPDPWPKKRHRKRRLINPHFIGQAERTLSTGGTLDLATDFQEYFEEATGLLNESKILQPTVDLPERVRLLGTGMTNFEVKYVAEGRPIYRAAYVKTGGTPC